MLMELSSDDYNHTDISRIEIEKQELSEASILYPGQKSIVCKHRHKQMHAQTRVRLHDVWERMMAGDG